MMSRRHNSHLVTYGLQVKWAGRGQAGRRREAAAAAAGGGVGGRWDQQRQSWAGGMNQYLVAGTE